MDARKCISYLTIELRGAIPEDLREPMGLHVFGCDICQDVCPWNGHAPTTQAMEFQPRGYGQNSGTTAAESSESSKADLARESLFLPDLEWLASISEREFLEMFAGSPIKRTKWKGLIRNVCMALGNSKVSRDSTAGERLIETLLRLRECVEPIVAESAQWAIARIQGSEGAHANLVSAAGPERARPVESDSAVP